MTWTTSEGESEAINQRVREKKEREGKVFDESLFFYTISLSSGVFYSQSPEMNDAKMGMEGNERKEGVWEPSLVFHFSWEV